MSSTAALFEPIQVGAVQLRNRVGSSALTRNRAAPTNVPNDTMAEYYRQRAEGGAGLLVSEGVLVTQSG
jgi:2,4-dienoyl-CoA reductase-like NADH-dependent reductase (Old Yellow Enzyme family)